MFLADTCSVVNSIFFLESVQTALSGADLYYWFAAGFGNTGNLTEPFVSFVDVQIMGSVVCLIVQFFFVYRIFVLSETRSWWLCVIICLVNSFPLKFHNDLIILPVVLHYRLISGDCRGCLCEPSPIQITQNMSQITAVVLRVWVSGRITTTEGL